MATSHLCPRCGRRHEATAPCDRNKALRSLLTATADQQRTADQLEAISLARYQLYRRTAR
jgi:hypothetical protein